jgi:hypothetical protein
MPEATPKTGTIDEKPLAETTDGDAVTMGRVEYRLVRGRIQRLRTGCEINDENLGDLYQRRDQLVAALEYVDEMIAKHQELSAGG